MTKLRVVAGLAGSVVMVPEMLQQWITSKNIKPRPLVRAPGEAPDGAA